MTLDDAILAMNTAINTATSEIADMTLSIYVLDAAEYDHTNGLALSLGWHS